MNEGKPKVNKPKFMTQFAIDNWFHRAVNDQKRSGPKYLVSGGQS